MTIFDADRNTCLCKIGSTESKTGVSGGRNTSLHHLKQSIHLSSSLNNLCFHDYSSKIISSNGQLIEPDTCLNTTLCRNYIERQFVELAFVEISSNLVEKWSKVCRKFVEKSRHKKTKVAYQNSATGMRVCSSTPLYLFRIHDISS